MTFASLNAAVVDLRNSLCSFVGEKAIGEITVRPPAADDDEASFLRLVTWSYALLFEAGRITIPYLLQLPADTSGKSSDPAAARKLVRDLRTWGFHNLGFQSSRDAALSRRVQLWFVEKCDTYPPDQIEAWRKCFRDLCLEVQTIIVHCQDAMINVLTAPDDGEAATSDLQRRINRSWAAYEFHGLVNEAAIRLGITIDAKKFCDPNLSKWRKYLECVPEQDSLVEHMIRMIERDLLDHVADVLPIDGRDVMSALGLEPGPDVNLALRRARELFHSGVHDRKLLLENLSRSDGAANGSKGTRRG